MKKKPAKKARTPRVWKGWVVLYPANASGPDVYEGQQGEPRGLSALPSIYETRGQADRAGFPDRVLVPVEIREVLEEARIRALPDPAAVERLCAAVEAYLRPYGTDEGREAHRTAEAAIRDALDAVRRKP